MNLYYRTENLRALGERNWVPLRPLTVLVGRNGAGKSTFLRSFPLLKQSIETKGSAPVLWWGDYVDFGNYKSAVKNRDLERDISFEFRLEDLHFQSFTDGRRRFISRANVKDVHVSAANLKVVLRSDKGRTSYREISLSLDDSDIQLRIEFPKKRDGLARILINEVDFSDLCPNVEVSLPLVGVFEDPLFTRIVTRDGRKYHILTPFQVEIRRRFSAILAGVASKRLNLETVIQSAGRLLGKSVSTNTKFCDISTSNQLMSIKRVYEKIDNGELPDTRRNLTLLLGAHHLLEVLHEMSGHLSDYFLGMNYIGPARVRSERFYRQQELQVSSIAADGHNLPNFLASLTKGELGKFSDWVRSGFEYGISIEQTEAHISIILDREGRSANVIDSGYGVSQILPVLAQVWWMKSNGFGSRLRRGPSPETQTLAIEQPELHLHPAHQARLADVFASAISGGDDGVKISLLVETHSESLLQRLGELIENKRIAHDDIAILVFEDIDGEATIRQSKFDEFGILTNWPYGFFGYNMK